MMITLKEIEAIKDYKEKCTAAMMWLESRGIVYVGECVKMHYNLMRYIERLEERVQELEASIRYD